MWEFSNCENNHNLYLNLENYHNFESSNALTVVVLAALLNKAKSPNPSLFFIFLENYKKIFK